MTRRGRTLRVWFHAALTAMTAAVVIGCGHSSIRASRVEAALEATFANLVELQVSRLGLRPMMAPDFAVTAICRKQVAPHDMGSGDWMCTLVWQGPDRRTLRDTYDLFVTTDGCYTAAVEGESLGGPMLKAADGRAVKNLLYAFDGCFDTT